MRQLTSGGFYDDKEIASANIGGEDFEVRDMELGHPPSRSAPQHGDNPQQNKERNNQQPSHQQRRQVIEKWNNDPNVQKWGIVAIEKNKLLQRWILIGILSIAVIIGIISIFWFNGSLGKLAEKNFDTAITMTDEPDNIYNNYTNHITSNPHIDNDHIIYNNITVSVPDSIIASAVEDGIASAFDFDDMVDEITDNLIDELKPFIEGTIQNATNST